MVAFVRLRLAALGLVALATLLALPGGARAGSIIQPVPFDETFFVPCVNGGAGEDVEVTGTARFFTAIEHPPAGGLLFFGHSWVQDGSGVGLTTGATYRFVSGQQDNEAYAPSGTSSVTVVTNVRVVGKGEGFLLHIVSHLTVLPDGTVAASVDDASAECR
jgi:hypothetical protein